MLPLKTERIRKQQFSLSLCSTGGMIKPSKFHSDDHYVQPLILCLVEHKHKTMIKPTKTLSLLYLFISEKSIKLLVTRKQHKKLKTTSVGTVDITNRFAI